MALICFCGSFAEGGFMAVNLHSLRFENAGAPVLVILHGLLGSSRNWVTIGKALQDRFDVHALDLRNHGGSPHADSMRWSELSEDLRVYLEMHHLSKIVLMGHSLGGKVAMRFACEYAEVVQRLIVVDIAAKPYPPYHDREFRAMKRIPVRELANRKEAEELLEPMVPEWALRQFLLTNLVRDEVRGGFRWQVNLEAVHASLPHIRQNSLLDSDRYHCPVLLVRGANSDFIDDEDADEMRHWFPNLSEVIVPSAGHNVHVENRKGFLDVLTDWLS
jgi:pimeloyl-ACP methyl ester carboxylesterase